MALLHEHDDAPPYCMCSEEECHEREKTMEVSEWEATLDSMHKNPKFRRMDPCLAVAKYRRSAAGTSHHRPPRSLFALHKTWIHLRTLLIRQQRDDTKELKSLVSTVAFVDDRVRAMQVDLVLSRRGSSELQIQFLRHHLLSLYLLYPLPRSKFEPKFSRQALVTALTTYWTTDTTPHHHDSNDQVLAITTLCQVAANLLLPYGIDSWVPPASITECYRNNVLDETNTDKVANYTLFQRALKVASAAHGEWHYLTLRMLADWEGNLGVLFRICVAPALNVLRHGVLEHCNKAFMKKHCLDGTELARLLCLPTAHDALRFCRQFDLALSQDKKGVLFKVGPMHTPRNNEWLRYDRATEDHFVFGDGGLDRHDGRIDEDGLSIPPPELFQRLLLQAVVDFDDDDL